MKPKFTTILLATLFSIILWVFVSFSYEYTTSFRVPVEFVDIKEGYALLSQSAKDVNITVKGQGWVLAQVASGPETVYQISTNTNVGTQKVEAINALSQNSWINPSMQVAIVSPKEINYSIEKLISKVVPIISDDALSIKDGYGLVSKIYIMPDSVQVSGPESLIKNITNITTEKIKIEDIDEQFSTQVNLKSLSYIEYSQNYVNIEFDVQKIVDKTFKSIKVKVNNVPNLRELELFPPSINITLRGGLENLGVMSGDSIIATVDFRDAFVDSLGAIEPKIDIPNFTTLTIVNPKTLKYIIKQN